MVPVLSDVSALSALFVACTSGKLPTPGPAARSATPAGTRHDQTDVGVWLVSRFLWSCARFFDAFGAAGALSVFVGLMRRRLWWRRQVGCWCSVFRRRRGCSVSRARMLTGWWRGASSCMCGWGVGSWCPGTRSTPFCVRLRMVRRPRERRHGRRGRRQWHGRVAGGRGVG